MQANAEHIEMKRIVQKQANAPKYSANAEILLKQVKDHGFNIYAMLGLFKKRSKLAPKIPDEVIEAVCREYLTRGHLIQNTFPYFLTVLTRKSREYFAAKNIKEHRQAKNEPMAFKNVLREITKNASWNPKFFYPIFPARNYFK